MAEFLIGLSEEDATFLARIALAFVVCLGVPICAHRELAQMPWKGLQLPEVQKYISMWFFPFEASLIPLLSPPPILKQFVAFSLIPSLP